MSTARQTVVEKSLLKSLTGVLANKRRKLVRTPDCDSHRRIICFHGLPNCDRNRMSAVAFRHVAIREVIMPEKRRDLIFTHSLAQNQVSEGKRLKGSTL